MPSHRFANWVRAVGSSEVLLGGVCTDLFSLLLPGECAGCSSPAVGGVCDQCLAECVPPRGPSCPTCGASWQPTSHRTLGCGRCARFGRPFAFEAAVSFGSTKVRRGGSCMRSNITHGEMFCAHLAFEWLGVREQRPLSRKGRGYSSFPFLRVASRGAEEGMTRRWTSPPEWPRF